MHWGFNGRQFSENGVAADEIIPFDQLEVWELLNETAPMAMNHPVHIHGAQFQVLSRSVNESYMAGWESVRHGYVDEGWKDTVLLMPGERVRLLIRFGDFAGTYVYHCHNLEHSDSGMMRNLRIE
ncbi:MAG: multicopper oxidase domain-containing protein [Planctomycetia bacterium]|nr:MAG: multicopper oxidase domain-containing protein [Planctomycetia bacterium]